MKYVRIKFPDIIQLSKFRVDNQNADYKIDNWQLTITGKFSDEQIVLACTKYRGILDALTNEEFEE
jgi:hypothetical protein